MREGVLRAGALSNYGAEVKDARGLDVTASHVDAVAAVLKQYPTAHVRIAGFADTRGSEASNVALGKARADSVKAALVAKGIELESGRVVELDAILCATGFDLSFCPRFPLVGRDGDNLQDRWAAEVPKAYMSCAVPGMPNYFSMFWFHVCSSV